MADRKIIELIEHPLAAFGIAGVLCLYYPVAYGIWKRVFQSWFREPLAECNLMKQVRMLGGELSTISLAAMVKAAIDSKSNLSLAIREVDPQANWVFYAWLATLYLALIFSPSIFVRSALLERERRAQESWRDWSLFVWRWTLVSWLLGFVNLHIALKFITPIK